MDELGVSMNNPVKVKSPAGELDYMRMLMHKSGQAIAFHRLGSSSSSKKKDIIDIYEWVTSDGEFWGLLFFDMYAEDDELTSDPPVNFEFFTFDKKIELIDRCDKNPEDRMNRFTESFGVNSRVKEFPIQVIEQNVELLFSPLEDSWRNDYVRTSEQEEELGMYFFRFKTK